MKRLCLCLAITLAATAPAARADCATDLAKLTTSGGESGLTVPNPRSQALVDKATQALAKKDEKSCTETVKGLKQLVAKQ